MQFLQWATDTLAFPSYLCSSILCVVMPQAIAPGLEIDNPVWGIRGDQALRDYYGGYFEAIGSHLRDGIALLDYGSGPGRFANYLSERVEQFRYWGIEQATPFGQYSTDYAISLFGSDHRLRFGVAGSAEDQEAREQADVVVLSSVFTHLDFTMYETLMAEFEPILSRGGIVVFSCFLDNTAHYHPGVLTYGPGTYDAAFYTAELLDEWATRTRHALVLVTSQFVDSIHWIIRVEAATE
jgi:SAM-dependent methyltransferase